MIVILKPRFLPAIFIKTSEDGKKAVVRLLGKEIEVDTSDIKPVKLPHFRKD